MEFFFSSTAAAGPTHRVRPGALETPGPVLIMLSLDTQQQESRKHDDSPFPAPPAGSSDDGSTRFNHVERPINGPSDDAWQ